MKLLNPLMDALRALPYENRTIEDIAEVFLSVQNSYMFGESECPVTCGAEPAPKWVSRNALIQAGEVPAYWHLLLATMPKVELAAPGLLSTNVLGFLVLGRGNWNNNVAAAKIMRDVLSLATPTPGKSMGDLIAEALGYQDWVSVIPTDLDHITVAGQSDNMNVYVDDDRHTQLTAAASAVVVWAPHCRQATDSGDTPDPSAPWNHLAKAKVLTMVADYQATGAVGLGCYGPAVLAGSATTKYTVTIPTSVMTCDAENMTDLRGIATSSQIAAVDASASKLYLRY